MIVLVMFLCVDRASCGVRGVDVFKALMFIKSSKQDNRLGKLIVLLEFCIEIILMTLNCMIECCLSA